MASSKRFGFAVALLLAIAPLLRAEDPPTEPRPLDAAALAALGINDNGAPPTQTDAGAWEWSAGPILYDGSGNITAIGTQTFAYDVRGRLVEANMTRSDQPGSHQHTYTYDQVGNMTSRTAVTQTEIPTPTLVSTNRLTSNSAVYDAAGNVVQLQPPNQSTVYAYVFDPLNMMQKTNAVLPLSAPRYFVYTADDERLWAYDGTTSTSRWTIRDLGGKVLRDYTLDFPNDTERWRLSRDYVYRDGQPLAAVTPTETLHFSLDHLGSTRVITDNGKTRVGLHYYLPYGEEWLVNSQSTDSEPMKYTGHERDKDVAGGTADVDYMHARFYMGRVGRFLSVDPNSFWELQHGNAAERAKFHNYLRHPQRWNRYAYVSNNPINRIDPDGREENFYMEQLLHEQQMVGEGQMSIDTYWARRRSEGVGALIGSPGAALWAIGPSAVAFGRDALVAIGSRLGMSGAAAEMTRRVISDSNRMNHISATPITS